MSLNTVIIREVQFCGSRRSAQEAKPERLTFSVTPLKKKRLPQFHFFFAYLQNGLSNDVRITLTFVSEINVNVVHVSEENA